MFTMQESFTTTQFIPGSLEAQVGNTPLLNLQRTAVACNLPSSIQLLAKAEWFNPSGSVKDRAALHIIQTAEQHGRLWPGMTILDSTSGNMGIAYAMFGAARGYKLKIVMPENASLERIAILRHYGVELIFSDGAASSDGAIELARQLAADDPTLFYANQYDNPANWQACLPMGEEIWAQTYGRITHFVCTLGSSGTFTGVTLRLRELSSDVQCIAAQPATAHEGIAGLKHMPSAIRPAIYDETLADDNMSVTANEARHMLQILAQKEGLFVGPSAAAAVAAAVKVARTQTEGTIVTVLPDNGLKYLSKPL
jgi:cysteine synthase B